MTPLTAMVIIFVFQIVSYTVLFIWYRVSDKKADNTPKEIDHEMEAKKAKDTLAEYCVAQKEEGHCRFNLNDSNAECDCKLLKAPPEEW